MAKGADFEFPGDDPDERELYLRWLDYLRGAVLRNVEGLDDAAAHHRPDGKLLPLAGIVNHLTWVERRWIDGGYLGEAVFRREEEFFPPASLTVDEVSRSYRARGARTDEIVCDIPLETPNQLDDAVSLRWTLLHLINETARHAGHADAVRELLDGSTGE